VSFLSILLKENAIVNDNICGVQMLKAQCAHSRELTEIPFQ